MSVEGAQVAMAIHGAGLALSGEVATIDVSCSSANRCRHGAKPHPADPGYIHACHEQRWRLATWRKSEPTAIVWRPARCFSWRHDGPCRRAKAAEDYARIKAALENVPREHVTYAVMTLDPSAWTAKGWTRPLKRRSSKKTEKRPRREGAVQDHAAIGASYRALVDRWTAFAKSLKREYGPFGYVSTVEQHRSGWPHMNVIFVNETLANDVKKNGRDLANWGRKSKGREVARRVFSGMLEPAGFGSIAFLEPALAKSEDGEDRLAAYIAKLAGDPGAAWDGEKRGLLAPADDAPAGVIVESIEGHTVSEISKYSQVPTRAPSHFRRLRSSKGFLPPKHRDEDVTGELFNESGMPVAANPVRRVERAAENADTREACENVMRQASSLLDRWENRATKESTLMMAALAGIKLNENDVDETRQTRHFYELQRVIRELQLKIDGYPSNIGEKDPDYVPPGHTIAPMDGMTITSADDLREWLGKIGPGFGSPARKYHLSIKRWPIWAGDA